VDFGTTGEASQMMTDIAVSGLDSKGQVLAGKQLFWWDQPVKPCPIIPQETAGGRTVDELLDAYPHLTREGIKAALIFARAR